MRYFTLTPHSLGECTFRLAYAKPWEFSWEDEVNGKYVRIIEIEITVVE